jgi:hypothetical protein
MSTYYNAKETLCVDVDNALQGWRVRVSTYDTANDWRERANTYMIAENMREAVTDALLAAGIPWEDTEALCDTWGIEYPEDDED